MGSNIYQVVISPRRNEIEEAYLEYLANAELGRNIFEVRLRGFEPQEHSPTCPHRHGRRLEQSEDHYRQRAQDAARQWINQMEDEELNREFARHLNLHTQETTPIPADTLSLSFALRDLDVYDSEVMDRLERRQLQQAEPVAQPATVPRAADAYRVQNNTNYTTVPARTNPVRPQIPATAAEQALTTPLEKKWEDTKAKAAPVSINGPDTATNKANTPNNDKKEQKSKAPTGAADSAKKQLIEKTAQKIMDLGQKLQGMEGECNQLISSTGAMDPKDVRGKATLLYETVFKTILEPTDLLQSHGDAELATLKKSLCRELNACLDKLEPLKEFDQGSS